MAQPEGVGLSLQHVDTIPAKDYEASLMLLTRFVEEPLPKIEMLDQLNVAISDVGDALRTVVIHNGSPKKVKLYALPDKEVSGFHWWHEPEADSSLGRISQRRTDTPYYTLNIRLYDNDPDFNLPVVIIGRDTFNQPNDLKSDENYTTLVTIPAGKGEMGKIGLTQEEFDYHPGKPILPRRRWRQFLAKKTYQGGKAEEVFIPGKAETYLDRQVQRGYARLLRNVVKDVVAAARPPTVLPMI